MKKYFFLGCAICAAFAMTSCKSQESMYKQAYERAQLAQQQDGAGTQVAPVAQNTSNVVAPVQDPNPTVIAPGANTSNVVVRSESVTLVNGEGLQNYSVVCGSFSMKENAEGLQRVLKEAGYPAQIAVNTSITPNMYRVIATTHIDKESAVRSRDALRGKYADAWLLYRQ